jgi:pimeloyl-ACP methyl ester carboxylesterase
VYPLIVFFQDLRNHGHSPHTPRHTYPLLAVDLSEFITKHGLKNPTLIGHSMGAKAVMTLALREPDRIANLIAVDNAPVDAMLKSDFGTYVRGMKAVEKVGVSRQSEADEILQKYIQVCYILRRRGTSLRFKGWCADRFMICVGAAHSTVSVDEPGARERLKESAVADSSAVIGAAA